MPPKRKFSREEIILKALEIASDKGMNALTSRELATALGSTASPIFTAFKNMDEVKNEVRNAALAQFNKSAQKARHFTPVFKQVGLQMIFFAIEQPKLYKILFMSEKKESQTFDDVFANLGEMGDLCIEVIQKDYDLSFDDAMLLFKHTWTFTYGIGALIASGMCKFTENEIQDMLSSDFVAMLSLIKSGKAGKCTTLPKRN